MYKGNPRRLKPYMKSYKQARNAENGRNSLSHGRAHWLVTQYKMFTLKTNIKVPYRLSTLYLLSHMQLQLMKNETIDSGKSKVEFKGRKWQGKVIYSKSKKIF